MFYINRYLDILYSPYRVVCRMLGYQYGVYISAQPGTGPIWMDELWCHGDEQSLEECVFGGWGNHDCQHSEDIGLICSNQPVFSTTTGIPSGW